jgi:hypothetical protein
VSCRTRATFSEISSPRVSYARLWHLSARRVSFSEKTYAVRDYGRQWYTMWYAIAPNETYFRRSDAPRLRLSTDLSFAVNRADIITSQRPRREGAHDGRDHWNITDPGRPTQDCESDFFSTSNEWTSRRTVQSNRRNGTKIVYQYSLGAYNLILTNKLPPSKHRDIVPGTNVSGKALRGGRVDRFSRLWYYLRIN